MTVELAPAAVKTLAEVMAVSLNRQRKGPVQGLFE
jgi:hypothetical protein